MESEQIWGLLAFLVAALGVSGGILAIIRYVIVGILADPARLRSVELLADSLPQSTAHRLLDALNASNALVEKYGDVLLDTVRQGIKLGQEALDGVPAENKAK